MSTVIPNVPGSVAAINKIEQLALSAAGTIGDAIFEAIDERPGDSLTPVAAIPTSHQVVNLEAYARRRARMRAAFSTHRILDFVCYINQSVRSSNDNDHILVDIESLSARIVLDAGTPDQPGHCDHTATLKLRPTSAWTALLQVHGKRLAHRAMLDFLEDWRLYWPHALPSLIEPEASPITQAAALTALRSVKLDAKATTTHAEGNLQRQRTALEQIEASSAAGRLPEAFVFEVEPYIGLDRRSIVLNLQVHPDDVKPQLSLRIVGIDALQESIADEFAEKVRAAAGLPREDGGEWTVMLGTWQPGK